MFKIRYEIFHFTLSPVRTHNYIVATLRREMPWVVFRGEIENSVSDQENFHLALFEIWGLLPYFPQLCDQLPDKYIYTYEEIKASTD